MPIILGRSLLVTDRTLVDMEKEQMKFMLNNEESNFKICRSMKQSGELQMASPTGLKVSLRYKKNSALVMRH